MICQKTSLIFAQCVVLLAVLTSGIYHFIPQGMDLSVLNCFWVNRKAGVERRLLPGF